MPVIPLFPLGTLLVPGQALPLRLFEDRYLALHDDLMARPEDQRSVGIVLIQGGSEVGDGNAGPHPSGPRVCSNDRRRPTSTGAAW